MRMNFVRRCPAVANFPVYDEWHRHNVAKKTHSRHDDAERGGLRDNIEELDLDHVAGLGALDKDGSGQRMDKAGVNVRKIRGSRARTDLSVERVAGLQYHFFAFSDFQYRGDIGVVTIVATMRLGRQGLFPIDADCVHSSRTLSGDDTVTLAQRKASKYTDLRVEKLA
jgi:hypothetical protein